MSPLEVAFLIVFWTWALTAIFFLRSTFLPRLPLTLSPASLGLSAETVRFQATDGVQLEGWKIPGPQGAPWIIMCHGLGSNRCDLLDMAVSLHTAGFNLFLFDFRGHGGSSGRTTSFGYHEQRDLEGALAFLSQLPEVAPKPFGIYGISMGAAVALMVAARDERLGAIAADSPYTTLAETLGRHLWLLYRLPAIPLLWFVSITYRIRFGLWPRRLSPRDAVTHLGQRPLLLIHGALDQRVPIEGAKTLYAAAGNSKDFLVVEDAGHLEAYSVDPVAYLGRLARFFEANLLEPVS